MKILINAGPTRESIDPVRFITNHSTGKMGYALAAAAVSAGHEVTLVSGPVALTPPAGLKKLIRIVTAAEMAEAMKQAFPAADLTILCAAVADYRPKFYSASKLKKQEGGMILELERTEDIALTLGQLKKPGQLLAGFCRRDRRCGTECPEETDGEKIRLDRRQPRRNPRQRFRFRHQYRESICRRRLHDRPGVWTQDRTGRPADPDLCRREIREDVC